MKATCAFALLMSFYFLTASVYCSKLTEKTSKFRRRPSRPLLQKVPFCSRMCNGGAGRFASNMFPPYRCSCSESCAVFGDCCYDSPYRSTELWHQYEFVCISVMERSGYLAVSSCSPGLHLRSCKGNLGILPPVTSSETNVTYANHYCAWCNADASDLITWNVDLSCPPSRDDYIYGHYNHLQYSSHGFSMVNTLRRTERLCRFKVQNGNFRIIDGLELRPCVKVDKISRCSHSWKDAISAKKCASYEDPIFLGNKVFRNPDCAHCNFVNLTYVECEPRFLKTTFGRRRIANNDVIRYCLTNVCSLDISTGQPSSFSNVFKTFHTEISCSKGERFDPRTNRCRKLRFASKKRTF